MAEVVLPNAEDNPDRFDPAQRAFDRAVKKAFLSGEAYDPDGKGYAYWKARDDAEKAEQSVPTPSASVPE